MEGLTVGASLLAPVHEEVLGARVTVDVLCEDDAVARNGGLASVRVSATSEWSKRTDPVAQWFSNIWRDSRVRVGDR